MRHLIIFILFLQTFTFLAQDDDRRSLIVVQVEPGWGSKFRQQIIAYHFLNGSFIGRDAIISVTGKVEGKDLIRTDIGNNVIYKDRYLITGIGNIIDLQEKKVLFDGRASLVRCENDSAVFYTNDIFKGKFYSVYNFKTKQYGEVKALLFKAKVGQDIEFDKTASPFKLYYYPSNKARVLLTDDAGYGQPATGQYPPDPPVFWIDQDEFVFGHFNRENTQLSLYRSSVKTKEKKLIGKINIAPEKQPATIIKLEDKRLLMSLGYRQIFIDLKAETVTDLDYAPATCGFSYACRDSSHGRVVKLNDKDVGSFHFRPVTFKADKNIAAFVKEITVGTESYQQGLAVWNATSGSWTTVECEEVLAMVGWINH